MNAYRADVVGSLLRPDWLLQAKKAHRRGELSDAELRRTEDRAVDECVALQERAGVDVVTDGEMRRHMFASQLAQACAGFEHRPASPMEWTSLAGEVEEIPVALVLVSKLERRRHLSVEELVYLRARTELPKKITLPSPTLYAYYWAPGISEAAYPTADAYLEAVAGILRDEVTELERLGASYLQFDAPELGMLLDAEHRSWLEARGFEARRLIEQSVELINGIIAGVSGPTYGLHICRGNHQSRYIGRGGYADLARRVFRQTRVQRLLLEYDDERSGDFAPLREVPEDLTVVLGLVTTKIAREETPEELRRRIEEAARYLPLERLALSPQCGFASVDKGNPISPEVQEQKLHLVATVANDVWG